MLQARIPDCILRVRYYTAGREILIVVSGQIFILNLVYDACVLPILSDSSP